MATVLGIFGYKVNTIRNVINSTKELEIFLDFWIVPIEATFFRKSSQENLWLDFKKLGAK